MKKPNFKIIHLIIVCLFSLHHSKAQSNFNKAKMDSLLDVLATKDRFMGSLTISKNGAIVYNRTCGIASIDNNAEQQATINTKYRIGSISKMFTSVMIFQLIEEKKLSMETKLVDFFPQIPNSKKITISNLLNHSSGIYDIVNGNYDSYMKWKGTQKSKNEIVKMITEGKPAFKPNKKSEYSNSNYMLLGYIIEETTKKNYSTNLKERITEKIGIKNTYYGTATNTSNNECFSFKYNNNKWGKEEETDMSIPGGAGAIVSTTNDLTKFITELFKEKLVNRNSLKDMITIKNGYGKGTFRKLFFIGDTCYGHTGGIDEFHSSLFYSIKDSVTIAICCNAEYGTSKLTRDALRIYYNYKFNVPTIKSVTVSKDTLRMYEGTYKHWILPIKMIIKLNGNLLTVDVNKQGPSYFNATSNKEFNNYSGGASFVINGNKLIWSQGGKHLKFKRKRK